MVMVIVIRMRRIRKMTGISMLRGRLYECLPHSASNLKILSPLTSSIHIKCTEVCLPHPGLTSRVYAPKVKMFAHHVRNEQKHIRLALGYILLNQKIYPNG